jgi:hypothetical protein
MAGVYHQWRRFAMFLGLGWKPGILDLRHRLRSHQFLELLLPVSERAPQLLFNETLVSQIA